MVFSKFVKRKRISIGCSFAQINYGRHCVFSGPSQSMSFCLFRGFQPLFCHSALFLPQSSRSDICIRFSSINTTLAISHGSSRLARNMDELALIASVHDMSPLLKPLCSPLVLQRKAYSFIQRRKSPRWMSEERGKGKSSQGIVARLLFSRISQRLGFRVQ